MSSRDLSYSFLIVSLLLLGMLLGVHAAGPAFINAKSVINAVVKVSFDI